MTRFFICSILFLGLVAAVPTPAKAGNTPGSGMSVNNNESDGMSKLPLAAKAPVPVEKTHAPVPSWDELVHIHHFHKDRLKKMKRHYRKSVWMSKLLLLIVHAAILFVSYLHVVH